MNKYPHVVFQEHLSFSIFFLNSEEDMLRRLHFGSALYISSISSPDISIRWLSTVRQNQDTRAAPSYTLELKSLFKLL